MDDTDKILIAAGGAGVLVIGYLAYKNYKASPSALGAMAASKAIGSTQTVLPSTLAQQLPAASAPQASYAPTAQELQREFKYNQERLILLGYSLAPYGADGKPGSTTTRQIIAFQIKEGLPQTGSFDGPTVERLRLRTQSMVPPSVQAARDAQTKYGQAYVGPDGKTYIPTEGGGV